METENGFRITTYKKKDLACLYCPNATARCAIRTLTRWIKRNHELYEALAHTGYNVRTRTFGSGILSLWRACCAIAMPPIRKAALHIRTILFIIFLFFN